MSNLVKKINILKKESSDASTIWLEWGNHIQNTVKSILGQEIDRSINVSNLNK